MTSSNGNIFRVSVPLWGESTGHRWFPLTKASDAEHWWGFILAWTNRTNAWANNRDAGDLKRHCAHYDVTVMCAGDCTRNDRISHWPYVQSCLHWFHPPWHCTRGNKDFDRMGHSTWWPVWAGYLGCHKWWHRPSLLPCLDKEKYIMPLFEEVITSNKIPLHIAGPPAHWFAMQKHTLCCCRLEVSIPSSQVIQGDCNGGSTPLFRQGIIIDFIV